MSDSNRTFSLSGRSTNHVQQRPSLIRNRTNASTASAQVDIRTFGKMSTRKARAIAKKSATNNSEAGSTSQSPPNQTNTSVALVSKKRGRGCNKPEEAPANLADRRHISLTCLGGWADQKVSRTIGSHLRTGLQGGHPNWTEMSKDNKRTLWNKFECTYVWDPAEDRAIRALWEKTMSVSLTNAVHDAYEVNEKSVWCADQHWEELQAYWRSPAFLRRSAAAKANRSKAPRVTHTTGSKTMERAAIDKDQPNVAGSSSVGGGGRHTTDEEFDFADLLRGP